MKENKDKSGFTLIEMIVVLGVTVVLTLMVISNIRFGVNKNDLKNSAGNLAEILSKARNMSASGQKTEAGTFPRGGYGVHFDTAENGQYILFADNDGQGDFDIGEEIFTYKLDKNVIIQSISPTNVLDIVFLPPKPLICLNAACPGIVEANIVLHHIALDIDRSVYINPISGRIYEE